MSLKRRLLVPLALLTLAFFSQYVADIQRRQDQQLRAELVRTIHAVEHYWRRAVAQATDKLGVGTRAVLNDPHIAYALAEGDRAGLLEMSRTLMDDLRQRYGITHLYYHDPAGVNLLRVHQPDRFGDAIDRFTLREAMRTGGTAAGMELGPLGTFTLRSVSPVTLDGRTVGYLELGEELRDLIADIKRIFGVELFLAVHKHLLERAGWEQGMLMLGRNADWMRFARNVVTVRTLASIPDGLGALLAADPPSGEGPMDIAHEGKRFWGHRLVLNDAGGRQVAYLVLLHDVTSFLDELDRNVTHTLLVAGALYGLLFAAFYWGLGRTQRALDRSKARLIQEAEAAERQQARHIEELERERSKLQRIQQTLMQNRRSLVNAQRIARLGNWEWDPGSGRLSVSEELHRILGTDPEQPINLDMFLGPVHPDDRVALERAMRDAVGRHVPLSLEHRVLTREGEERVVHQQAEPALGASGETVRLAGIAQDITERKRAEGLSLRLGHVLERSWNEIYVFGADSLRFLQVSEGARRNLGFSLDELQRLTPLDLHPGLTADAFAALLAPLRGGEKESIQTEAEHRRKDGSIYPVDVRIQLSREEQPPVFVAIMQDTSERKAHTEQLERLALYDTLTGLPNRTLFHDRLTGALRQARRDGEPLTLSLLNLNRFREINDILGHGVGDLMLREVARRLSESLREVDTVARVGGDEFAIVQQGTGLEGASVVAERLRALLDRPVLHGDVPLELDAGLGIAVFPDHGTDAETLLQRADVAMRLAKQFREDFHVYASHENPYSLRRLQLLNDLRRAIQQGELDLHFQPKALCRNGRVDGCEALVRWFHPQFGAVSPGELVGLAEQTGLIRPLTLWVLRRAAEVQRRLRESGLPMTVAVNVSARDLSDGAFATRVAEILEATGGAPASLILEVTESAIMEQPDNALAVLKRLRDMGVGLAVDDFGTGYSSLAYLKRLPVGELKVDRSFVSAMAVDGPDRRIVRSVIDLAHSLGMEVTGEGVEDQAGWDLLAALGCDRVQGYFLARPMPVDDLEAWLLAAGPRAGARTAETIGPVRARQ